MKTIVFIGSQKSGSSRDAIIAAEKLGYYTVLLTDKPAFMEKRTEFPDVHLMQPCNLNDLNAIRNVIRGLQLKALEICAIVSFVDPYCHTACILAEELGINHFTTKAISNMLNKIDSREILSNTHYVPYYDVLLDYTNLTKEKILDHLPLVMKSPNSTGSKDVFKINSYEEFTDQIQKLLNKYPKEPILIEEYLDGPQYLVETVVYEDSLYIVAIFQQEITFTERFIVTGYNLMLDLPEDFLNKLKKAVKDIVSAHEMENGACHLEMRYVKEHWKLVEINPRISGGAMNKIIETGLGINLVEQTLLMALGQKPYVEPKYKRHTFTQYSIVSSTGILEKVTGRNKASKCEGVESVFIKPKKGALLTPPLSMGNRYAYVIAVGETQDKAKENAKYASSLINFSLLPIKEETQQETVESTISVDYNSILIVIADFKKYLVKSGRNPMKAKDDANNVDRYLDWYSNHFKSEFKFLKKEDIFAYRDYLRTTLGLSPSTINSKLSSLQRFNVFLVNESIQASLVIDAEDFIKASNKSSIDQNETDPLGS